LTQKRLMVSPSNHEAGPPPIAPILRQAQDVGYRRYSTELHPDLGGRLRPGCGLGAVHQALIIMGTRGEAIKLAPVLKAMRGHVAVTVCTGQHPALPAPAMTAFGIEPDIVLPDRSRRSW
jgi:hypothetical protein